MNADIQKKLSKYMKADGLYDTKQIRMNEGMTERSAKFMDIFGGADESDPEQESELLAAANAYNDAVIANETADQQFKINAVLGAEKIDWNAADALNLTLPSAEVDGEDRPLYRELTRSAAERRQQLHQPVMDGGFRVGDKVVLGKGWAQGEIVAFVDYFHCSVLTEQSGTITAASDNLRHV